MYDGQLYNDVVNFVFKGLYRKDNAHCLGKSWGLQKLLSSWDAAVLYIIIAKGLKASVRC